MTNPQVALQCALKYWEVLDTLNKNFRGDNRCDGDRLNKEIKVLANLYLEWLESWDKKEI